MEFQQIHDLMSAMNHYEIEEVDWRQNDGQIHLKRRSTQNANFGKDEMAKPPIPQHRGSDPQAPKGGDEDYWIVSPMVGTLYLTPAPDARPYVQVGDRVDAQSVVCIIEAMKVMNEVPAPLAGIVSEIGVQNSSAVEFGTKLMRITPQKV